MDLNHLRKEGFTESVYSWLREHQDAVLPDQDAINMVYKGKIKVVDFNYAWPSCWETDPDNILIFHYLGSDNKPWNNPNGLNANFYNDLKEESPLADFESGHATLDRRPNFY